LILACLEKSSTFCRQDVGCLACRTDAAYAEQRALVAIEQRLFATFSPLKK